jgi:hypothetical protein
MEAGSEAGGKLVNLVIAVNLNGLLGGIHDHVAFVAPMEMFIQFDLKVFSDPAIQVIRQLF